jgi:hypothetical protein
MTWRTIVDGTDGSDAARFRPHPTNWPEVAGVGHHSQL